MLEGALAAAAAPSEVCRSACGRRLLHGLCPCVNTLTLWAEQAEDFGGLHQRPRRVGRRQRHQPASPGHHRRRRRIRHGHRINADLVDEDVRNAVGDFNPGLPALTTSPQQRPIPPTSAELARSNHVRPTPTATMEPADQAPARNGADYPLGPACGPQADPDAEIQKPRFWAPLPAQSRTSGSPDTLSGNRDLHCSRRLLSVSSPMLQVAGAVTLHVCLPRPAVPARLCVQETPDERWVGRAAR